MIRRSSAWAVDFLMCASMNFVQSRHRLDPESREAMERYVAECEKLTPQDFYAVPDGATLAEPVPDTYGASLTWPSPLTTGYERNDFARADFYPGAKGWTAPTLLMLHALMSASDIGYKRWARHFNDRGWNVCFVHLPFHYSRVPKGYWNGELAITANLIRNAEGLRQGVMEVRQLIAALRSRGSSEFGILGSSYGAWIGALLAAVEPDLRFLALMTPIVHVEHAIWQCPATAFMRHELRKAGIKPELVARHFHLSSPLHMTPLTPPERVLLAAGDFDLVARASDVAALQEKWKGSELLRVPQGHFGYRVMRETVRRLEERGL